MSAAPFDPVALTQALVRCESVTPVEGGALTLLEGLLAGAGFTCHRMTFSEPGTPDVENLYARIGSHGRNLCFAGHTDVVPVGDAKSWTSPPFGAEIRNGVLYGRGAVDMKGAVACFVAAALRMLKAGNGQLPSGSISLLITGDEEGESINGTIKLLQWLKDRDERIDACLVGEPSNPRELGDEIKIGRRGSLNGDLTVHGKQGHAAYPERADNPVPKLARMIDRLSQIEFDGGTAYFQPTNLQATVISVLNTAINVIPAQAHVRFNVRYNNVQSRSEVEARVRDCCKAVAAEIGARFTLQFSGTGDVFLTEPGLLVDTMRAAVEAVTGRVPKLTTGGGTSDARFIKHHCPVVEFGLVNATIHQVDEHVSVADLEALTRIYEEFITRFFAAV